MENKICVSIHKGIMVEPHGIQSHGRSVIVWPTLLDESGVALLRCLVGFGIRIIVFGEVKECPIWPGEIEGEYLHVLAYFPSVGLIGSKQYSISNTIIHDVQTLQRECSLIPLPKSVYKNPIGWRHNALYSDNILVASASLQQLRYTPDATTCPTSLLCSVAVSPYWQRKGLGRGIISGLLDSANTPTVIALVEMHSNRSLSFFEKLGWIKTNQKATFVQWA